MLAGGKGEVVAEWEPRKLLKMKQVAQLLCCCEMTVRGLVWAGKLPFVRVGSRHLIEYRDVVAFIEANKAQHGARP